MNRDQSKAKMKLNLTKTELLHSLKLPRILVFVCVTKKRGSLAQMEDLSDFTIICGFLRYRYGYSLSNVVIINW